MPTALSSLINSAPVSGDIVNGVVYKAPCKIILVLTFFFLCFYSTEEKRHDARMLAEFALLQSLEVDTFSTSGQPRVHLQAPFREA
jgi:hypothetical protein